MEGALLSTMREELATVSYETGKTSGPVDEPCTGGPQCLLRHGVDGFSPSSWEPQEEGMMSTTANFPSVRNQGMSNPGKSRTQEGDAC
jgi:hypothetical protein